MNIAITGSSGFLGRHLLKKMSKEDKSKIDLWDKKKMDLFNPESLKNFLVGKDIIIHLAGVNKNGNVKDIIKVNILGTKKLLDSICKYCPDAKLIFASSFCVYDENDIFGLSKLTAEELIKDYVLYGLIKKAVILRFSNIYGPNCKPFKNSAIATFAYLIRNNKEITINGTGKQKKDFLYIDDASAAIEKAFNFNKGFKTFDVSSGRLTSINKVIETMERFSGNKAVIRYNEQNQKPETMGRKVKKADKLSHWKPLVSLENGLKRLMNEN